MMPFSLFIGTRTEIKIETKSPLTRAKTEAETFKETLIPNLIAETEDIDNQVPDRCTTELFFSSQTKLAQWGWGD